ncbi:DUF1783-domain-containing protein [Aulographum hederae CBS 113979]|uniref:DUF1783-domain-containing protein n=1 Tax=Aulographum hederae CBS 113979 TaxID=1176131 RepID=A0A6G1H4F2_9PEZI|nr:DUF1783-domain-containing protein [Aulographum hederae CBS 113979]
MFARPTFLPRRLFRPRLRVQNAPTKRTLIAAPKPNSGPLMERRSDRALPSIPSPLRFYRTVPLFLAIIGASCLAIFNYQKASSSVVNSTLYALRTNPRAREILGDEIYFASRMPWIWGSINQVQGRIDVTFGVKGTRGKGSMRFRSVRKTRMGMFDTLEWSLTTEDGTVVHLLENEKEDPFRRAELNTGSELSG